MDEVSLTQSHEHISANDQNKIMYTKSLNKFTTPAPPQIPSPNIRLNPNSVSVCAGHVTRYISTCHLHPPPTMPLVTLESQHTDAVLRCPFPQCLARIIKLSPDLCASLATIEDAPPMAKTSTKFYQINDVWDFDNIGVSKPTQDFSAHGKGPLARLERLLVCSECDQGPLGFAGFLHEDDTDVKNLTYFLLSETVAYDLT